MQGKTECSSRTTYQDIHCSTAAAGAMTAATVELDLEGGNSRAHLSHKPELSRVIHHSQGTLEDSEN